MKLISDTGPIIGLAKIGQFFLLKKLATEVLIVPFVQKELYDNIGLLLQQLRHAGYWLSDDIIAVTRKLASE